MSILNDIYIHAKEYGSIPFWSWNDKLDPEKLRRQIRRMKELGMNGFFMHARGGLETEYLSDEWFDCIRASIDEAKKLDMEAWSYDENGWPSGFAGGELLNDKDNFALGLLEEKVPSFKTDEDTVGVYVRNSDGTFKRVEGEVDGCNEYLRIYLQYECSYVDTLNADVTKKFVELTHQRYKDECGDDFGKAMPGFFTDEPQYFRWGHAYSKILPEEFRKAYGYEIYDGLPSLFYNDVPNGEKFRFDYYKLIHNLFINNWVKVVYDWCHENGVKLTGHPIEELTLGGQMLCCGGVMPFYEYEDIPGIDYLARGLKCDTSSKQLGSVCSQLDKKKALSEMYGCCGWDVSPRELKIITDMMYSNGVNLMCQHLYPYSERGQRKRDYPLHYSEHNPWQDSMVNFDWHYNRLGSALSRGEEFAPVLVIHPMHGTYMHYKKGEEWHKEIEDHFIGLSNLLGNNQVPYHYGDEILMSKYASVNGDKLCVGKCTYEAVIIPFTYSLDKNTVELLKTYLSAGGKVWLYKDVPGHVDGEVADLLWLQANVSWEDILAYRDAVVSLDNTNVSTIRKMTRILPDGSSLIFLTNVSKEKYDCVEVVIPSAKKVCEIDIDSYTDHIDTKKVYCDSHGDGKILYLSFDEAQSYLLWVNGEVDSVIPGRPLKNGKFIPVPETATLVEKPLNTFLFDIASLSKDGKSFDEPLSIYGIKDNLLKEKYNGHVWLKYEFNVADGFRAESLKLVLEPMRQVALTVNGTPVSLETKESWFDESFSAIDISKEVRCGKNEVIVEIDYYQRDYVYYVLYGGVSESLRNCLTFDTEIEAAYLIGDFAVTTDAEFVPDENNSFLYDGNFVITSQKDKVYLPNLITDGYPFFSGHMKASFEYEYSSGAPTVLSLSGRFATCKVTVNGNDVGTMLFDHTFDLEKYLKNGKNEIVLDFTCAMRNAFGPHHRPIAEPFAVSPVTFSFENEWNGRECANYLSRYAFVQFGVEGAK